MRCTLFRNAAACMLLCLAISATAQEGKRVIPIQYSGTLKQIKDSDVIRIGYRENSPPFAFLDAKGKPVGYSLDICDAVIEEIAAELEKEIRVAYRPVTPENRLDRVTSGEIDLECGSTTNTFDRRKRVAFSPTIFVTGIKLLVPRNSRARSLRDLQGKTIVLTRGTVHAELMPGIADRQKLGISFVTGGDHNESFSILTAGKADAFANDDVQLYGMLAETKSTGQYRVVGDFLTYADYALSFRKDDPDFAEIVERAFATRLFGSRAIMAIYDKWFMRPLPHGERLKLPMSPHLEQLFGVQGVRGD
ncbi:MAG: amino acid ABC transporter substrate-binding protein [Candidatus Accumulibacter sp.]|uniref:Amino acid ABC transporter substrate-binding protein n=1 Tax=Candidatus Accumulibacter affinis TaxID=2954384 RepID=A0A935T7S8_9PROT|nr:amino acid ABC transporter substrate-binding protein [Candidatus Accumulibacter affinis]